jgi:hypothetical protein
MITITHNRAEGTLVQGSERGDGVLDVLRSVHRHWRPFRSLGCLGLVQSRDKAAKTWIIESSAAALRKAGHEVTVEIDDTSAGRDVAEIEAERAERAEARAERFEDYAGNASERGSAAYAQARQMADAIPFGQPMMPDHHSYGRDRRYRDRMGRTYDRAFTEMGKAEHWQHRAAAAEANQAHRESIPATLRRIERLEADERSWQRALDGKKDGRTPRDERDGYKPAEGAYRERVLAELAEVRGQIAYWRKHVEESGTKVWGPADFSKGDYVATAGRWYHVERVNPKSLSVPHGLNDHEFLVVTRDKVRHAMGPSQWVRKVTYDEVRGRRSAEEMAEAMAAAEAQQESA